jgi:hypothetical protein
MKNAIFICSFIPSTTDKSFSILKENLRLLTNETKKSNEEYHIFLLDDGSEYIENYLKPKSNDIYQASDEENKQIQKSLNLLESNFHILTAPWPNSEKKEFRKCELIRHASKSLEQSDFEYIIVLDDDHFFTKNNGLEILEQHFKNNYQLVIGRILSNNGFYRSYFDNLVQGTTYAVSTKLFKKIDYISTDSISWGGGEDSELFLRLYNEFNRSPFKAIYDGDLITKDSLTGRWHSCMKEKGDEKDFITGFTNKYGVSPHTNKSRRKSEWLEYKNTSGIPEVNYIILKESEVTTFNESDLYKLMLDLRHVYTLYKYLFKGNKTKVKITRFSLTVLKKSFDFYYSFKNSFKF